MTKSVLMFSLALVAGASQAGWESWLKSGLFRASFEDYVPNQELDDTGAVNGTWGSPAVPADAEAKATSGAVTGKYMEFSTKETGIVFTPYSAGSRTLKSVVTSMLLSGCGELPALAGSPRGAFALYAPENGETNFVGWTSTGWRLLRSSGIDPIPGQWYDVSMKFVKDATSAVRVQYRLKRQFAGGYVTLSSAEDENEIWFPAGGDASADVVSGVEFRGDGAFQYLAGSEPRRGMLISLVPWREMLIDETVEQHGTGSWYAYDYENKCWIETPEIDLHSYAYLIDVPDGENYTGFLPLKKSEDDQMVVEFCVSFTAPNDNDATPDDACALVRVVDGPFDGTDVKSVDLEYRFACLTGEGWHTNTLLKAELDSDYTVQVTLDKKASTVDYQIRKGRGGESGAFQQLMLAPVDISIGDPLFAFFGGIGKVYGIKASGLVVR